MNQQKIIRVNNIAEEYAYVSKQRCKCGGAFEVLGQALLVDPPCDVLNVQCEECLKEKKFLFDISGFFGKYEDIVYKTEDFKCPKHGATLKRKPIVWGLTRLGAYGDTIFGGCCVPEEAPKHGYACPEPDCGTAYYINSEEELVLIHDEKQRG